MRSCEPLSWGEAGRVNSTSMPCSIHHTLKQDRRPSPVEAKGAPRSDADHLRDPDLPHQVATGAQRALELLVGLGPQGEHVVAEAIADGQRIAALPRW